MIISTKDFKKVLKDISNVVAVSKDITDLELVAKDTKLKLNVSNKEIYVSCLFNLTEPATFNACIGAKAFITLIDSITTETFDLTVDQNKLNVKGGKFKYSLPLIIDGADVKKLVPLVVKSAESTMTVTKSILDSIMTVNGAEIKKAEAIKAMNQIQQLYYITENGCFTFTNGACLNSFTLDSPINILISDRIVKLFKLFDSDVTLKYGVDELQAGTKQSKIALSNSNTYICAIINSDELLINKVTAQREKMIRMMSQPYKYNFDINVKEMSEVINRLITFKKVVSASTDKNFIPVKVLLNNNEIVIEDNAKNAESLTVSNNTSDDPITFYVNIADLKMILDTTTTETLKMSCFPFVNMNIKPITIKRENITNSIPEVSEDLFLKY